VGLRQQAAADLRAITEDSAAGFGWPITVTDPAGTTANVVGLSTDVSEMIDPQTGQAIAGRVASVAIAIATLAAAGLGLPKAIADTASKPWLFVFDDIAGSSHVFCAREVKPDRAVGLVVVMLEIYKP
jgi:hypothetical protein